MPVIYAAFDTRHKCIDAGYFLIFNCLKGISTHRKNVSCLYYCDNVCDQKYLYNVVSLCASSIMTRKTQVNSNITFVSLHTFHFLLKYPSLISFVYIREILIRTVAQLFLYYLQSNRKNNFHTTTFTPIHSIS